MFKEHLVRTLVGLRLRSHQGSRIELVPCKLLEAAVLITQLYSFLERRTDSGFNKVVLRRLYQSKQHRAPISISRLARYVAGQVQLRGPVDTCSIIP